MSTETNNLEYSQFLHWQETSGTNTPSPFGFVAEGGNCIICGKHTQLQLAGYWTHQNCAKYVADLIELAKVEIPLFIQQILFSDRELLEKAICGVDSKEDFESAKKELEEKAWEKFKEKHSMPWLDKPKTTKEIKQGE